MISPARSFTHLLSPRAISAQIRPQNEEEHGSVRMNKKCFRRVQNLHFARIILPSESESTVTEIRTLVSRMSNILPIFTVLLTTGIFFTGCTGKTLSNVTDAELRQLTEELFINENPDLQHHVRVDLQGQEVRRPYTDLANRPLLTVDSVALRTPLLQGVRALFDNYQMDTSRKEIVTPEEYDEEENFLDELLETDSIRRVMHFLSDRGFISGGNHTYRNTLRDLWFGQFARQKRSNVRGSSAFEHVFLGELKSGKKLIGMHNWIFFNAAERDGLLNYWGHKRTRNLGNSAMSVTDVVFVYSGKMKTSTIFIGTSPGLEISLYTLCYFVRPNKYCRVSMGGTKFGVQTYTLTHTGNRRYLGTAYPVA